MSAAAAGETDRCLANLLRIGTVKALDEGQARVQVECGDLVTDWLPWFTHRAGPNRTWHAPEVGEQVMVLAPSGDMAQGVVLPSIYQDAHPQPANLKTTHREEYEDGAFKQYDRQGHHFTLDVPAGGSITLHIGATTLKLEDSKATLTTPQLLVDSPQSRFTGAVRVEGLLTYVAGMAGSGGSGSAATIQGNINVTGGDVKADAISLKGHGHTEQGDGNRTSNSVV